MGAKWVHSDVLDGGLNALKANTTHIRLLKAYTAGDSFATVASNTVAMAATNSGEWTGPTGAANGPRTLTSAAKTGVALSADSGASPDLVQAYTDNTNSKVLWVTDITTDQQVYNGNTVNLPALPYAAQQPT